MKDRLTIRLRVLLALAFFLIMAQTPSQAAPGDRDPFFGGGDGLVTTPIDDGGNAHGNCVAIDAYGNILLTGYAVNTSGDKNVALSRYTADGSLDTTFGGGDGMITTSIGDGGDASGRSMTMDAAAKILIGGHAANTSGVIDFALARYNADGSLDATFGGGEGMVTTSIGDGGYAIGRSITIDAAGKILIGGHAADSSFEDHFALARYNSDGSLDTTFGNGNGYVITRVGDDVGSHGRAVAIDATGNILLAGYTDDWDGDNHFALARYSSNGSLDTTFGDGDGIVITDIDPDGHDAHCKSMVIDPEGRILLGGETWDASYDSDFALARYNSDGSLDTTFGYGKGYVITPYFDGGYDSGTSVLMDASGKIFLAGYAVELPPDEEYNFGSPSHAYFALARYNSDGSLDTTFGGGDGIITTLVGEIGYAHCKSAVIDSIGRIVLAGYAEDASENYDFALARYLVSQGSSSDGGGCFIRSLYPW
ncbi:MAG: hypothetical protein JRL30_20105 [Deltaproteobacteria bacterium]|nr:hypothetical protein [Deltaproteobacteria bacterium]